MTTPASFERPKSYEYADTRKLSETMKKYLEYFAQEISALQRDLLRAEINLPEAEKSIKGRFADVHARMETIVKETEEALRTNGEQIEALFKKIEDLITEAEGEILKKKPDLPEGRKRYGDRMHEYWTKQIESRKFIQGERVYREGKPMEHAVDFPNRWGIKTEGIVVGNHDISMSRKRWYLKSDLPSEVMIIDGVKEMIFRMSLEGDRAKLTLKEQAQEKPKVSTKEAAKEKVKAVPVAPVLRESDLNRDQQRVWRVQKREYHWFQRWWDESVQSQLRDPRFANFERIKRGFGDAFERDIDLMVSSNSTHILIVEEGKPFHVLAVIGINAEGMSLSIQLKPSFWNDKETVKLALAVKLRIERKSDLDRIHMDNIESRGDERVIRFTRNGRKEEIVVDVNRGDESPKSRAE